MPYSDAEAQIVAEIAARFVEWGDDYSRGRAERWLYKLTSIHRIDPVGAWVYLRWQTGNPEAIAASFEDAGADKAMSRQAAEQRLSRALQAISVVDPLLAQSMRELFETHSPEAAAATERKIEDELAAIERN